MEENKRTDSGYTGEYGNPVEHNDAPQVETENAAAYSETAQSASEQGESAQAEDVITAEIPAHGCVVYRAKKRND